jgi:acyl-coenzyme A synthetase/AMP-(fatty) acid ligase
LLKDEDVIDAAVVGLDDSIKGHVPFGFIVLKKGNDFLKFHFNLMNF